MSHVCLSQVVVKTKADYDAESKRGKLRSPKIAEFSISIIEGVSERLKVRTIWSPSPLPVTEHLICSIPPISAAPSMLVFVYRHVWAIVQGDSFNPAPETLINSPVAMAIASTQQHLSPLSHPLPSLLNRYSSYRMSRLCKTHPPGFHRGALKFTRRLKSNRHGTVRERTSLRLKRHRLLFYRRAAFTSALL